MGIQYTRIDAARVTVPDVHDSSRKRSAATIGEFGDSELQQERDSLCDGAVCGV
jgi:hypothetical protein